MLDLYSVNQYVFGVDEEAVECPNTKVAGILEQLEEKENFFSKIKHFILQHIIQ